MKKEEEEKREERLSELWEEFSKHDLTNEDLRWVIANFESLREKAGRKLLEQNPTNEDLLHIIKWVEHLRKEARKLLKRPKREIMAEMQRY